MQLYVSIQTIPLSLQYKHEWKVTYIADILHNSSYTTKHEKPLALIQEELQKKLNAHKFFYPHRKNFKCIYFSAIRT
ncbi:hypothetical protein ABE66_15600 [Cytobacillus firmus]|nr:hypothetical protein [Cytobacillus firmus]